jgi:hemerythrin
MRKTSEIIWQDTQHQVLFDILDLVGQPDARPDMLQLLRHYTENHFAIEEAYMNELAYPGTEEHIRAHNQFREEMDKMIAENQEQDELFMQIVSRFLTEWLTRHVFGIDKRLEEFILSSKRH